MDRITKHQQSFKNAISGLIWATKSEHNFQIHLLLSLLTIIAAVFLRVSYIEFIILIFAIVFGLGVELINTSLEEVTDLVTKEWREEVRIAKDVSAAMMLIVSLGTFIVAVLIFLPKILAIL